MMRHTLPCTSKCRPKASNTCLCHGVLNPGSAILPDLVAEPGTSADPRLSGGSSQNFNPFCVRRLESGTVISPRQGLGRMPAYWNVQGLPYGLIQTPRCQSSQCNILSATDKAEVVSNFLTLQCGEGRMLGPLPPEDSTGVITSRMAVIPKKVAGRWSMIYSGPVLSTQWA